MSGKAYLDDLAGVAPVHALLGVSVLGIRIPVEPRTHKIVIEECSKLDLFYSVW